MAEGDQLPAGHTVSPDETCNSRALKAGTLEKLVENLLTAFGDNDFKYTSIFLSTYRAFASTITVLELLLDRYGNLEISGSEEAGDQNSPKSPTVLSIAIASIFTSLAPSMRRGFPRATGLRLSDEDGFHSLSPCNPVDDEELEISSPEEFSLFQEEVVAEQLTYMDVTLFKKVVPHHCLGCVWSRRDKKENKHLAGSIRATISQFNAVTNGVVSTVLESKELKTQQRAKILEKWIRIARECRILNNFSSLKAIISALQSTSIYRLKKTWACVPEDIMLMFEELSDIFSGCDNFSTSRELLMKGVTQGTVPYLGTFLTDLMMLDTALQDYLEGGLINFEKSFRLSRGIEAAADKSITSATSQKSVVKRFSLPFLGLGLSAHSTPVKAQPKPAPGGSSGDSTVTIVTPTNTPEEPQRKLPETSSSHTTDHTTNTSSVGVSSLISSPPLLPSDAKCSKKCLNSVTLVTSKEMPPVQPACNQQNGDTCIIRTSLEGDRSGNIYKSILISSLLAVVGFYSPSPPNLAPQILTPKPYTHETYPSKSCTPKSSTPNPCTLKNCTPGSCPPITFTPKSCSPKTLYQNPS
ncbi:hypothetical protein AV530_008790 [Patagioenas fasciata monilis]|uniref:Ral guanine nucleotide dissociation stimulator-like 1 n=1 Tax=Patagioenas fasciata monilis TaxID=372326 RepID=A0A1V4JI72_PATFA|nr:hypothetical protein AV530_008790 [Patagioenas fasciata monilis]